VMNAERLMLIGGLCAFVLTMRLVYRENLREKYAVVWLAMAIFLLGLGTFPQVIMRFATTARLSYSSAVLFLSLAVIYLFAMSVSISLSRQHRRIMTLTQELALLRHRLEHPDQLEKSQGTDDSSCGSSRL